MKNFDSFLSDILTDEELGLVKGGLCPAEGDDTSIDFGDGS